MQLTETSELVLVTPEMAREWLTKYGRKKNRKVNKGRASGYAEYMAADRWMCSGDAPISFGVDGILMNGHTRLTAVILYGKPVWFVVRRNVPLEMLAFYDAHQSRTHKQVARMLGEDTAWDAALKVIKSARMRTTAFVSGIEVERLRIEFASEARVCEDALRIRVAGRTLNAGTKAGLLLCARHDAVAASVFVKDVALVASREGVGARAAINLVRWLENHRGAGAYAAGLDAMQAVVQAFSQFVAGVDQEFVKSQGLGCKGSLIEKLLSPIDQKPS